MYLKKVYFFLKKPSISSVILDQHLFSRSIYTGWDLFLALVFREMSVTSPVSHFATGLHWDHSSCVVINIRATCQNNPMTHHCPAWGREEEKRRCSWFSARQHKPISLPDHFQSLWTGKELCCLLGADDVTFLLFHWSQLGNLAFQGNVDSVCFTLWVPCYCVPRITNQLKKYRTEYMIKCYDS